MMMGTMMEDDDEYNDDDVNSIRHSLSLGAEMRCYVYAFPPGGLR